MNKKKAFTLLEMLIVLVILGILASALIPRLSATQGRARDVRRKTDLRRIYNANEVYRQDNLFYFSGGLYCSRGVACAESSTQGRWLQDVTGYIEIPIPRDPLNNSLWPWGGVGSYSYAYGYIYGATYDLTARLESPTDPDRCFIKHYTSAGGNRCSTATDYQLLEYSPDSNSFQ